jgi:hypothetical protein
MTGVQDEIYTYGLVSQVGGPLNIRTYWNDVISTFTLNRISGIVEKDYIDFFAGGNTLKL